MHTLKQAQNKYKDTIKNEHILHDGNADRVKWALMAVICQEIKTNSTDMRQTWQLGSTTRLYVRWHKHHGDGMNN